jgi:hypothetical protein
MLHLLGLSAGGLRTPLLTQSAADALGDSSSTKAVDWRRQSQSGAPTSVTSCFIQEAVGSSHPVLPQLTAGPIEEY